MHRVVSLIASATEITASLGCGGWLVGRSHECDYPRDVLQLPVCSTPRIDIHASSREIDRQVKERLTDALSIYQVRTDVIDELSPSVLLTQTQCEVCAVSLKDVQDAVCGRIGSRPEIVSLGAMNLADVWDDVRRVAAALGVGGVAEAKIADWTRRLADLQRATSPLPRPTIACIEWLDPLMAAGNWVPELVEIAGGENLFGDAGQHSPWMTWDDLIARDPDVIALMPCGFDLHRTRDELSPLVSHPAWNRLRAVQDGRVYLTDGNQYFNRPGPRLVESAEILVEILHPGEFSYDAVRGGWEKLETRLGA